MSAPDRFGWSDTDPTDAHSYLFPVIMDMIPGRGNLRILDIGCGNGWIAGRLAEAGHHVLGIDVARDGIEQARRANESARFEVASAYDDLTKLIENADVVISTEVLEHLYSPQQMLASAWRVLRPGGMMVLSTPFHGYLKNLLICLIGRWDHHHQADKVGGHIKFFSEPVLSRVLTAAGFVDLEFRNAGRMPFVWKSSVVRAHRPDVSGDQLPPI